MHPQDVFVWRCWSGMCEGHCCRSQANNKNWREKSNHLPKSANDLTCRISIGLISILTKRGKEVEKTIRFFMFMFSLSCHLDFFSLLTWNQREKKIKKKKKKMVSQMSFFANHTQRRRSRVRDNNDDCPRSQHSNGHVVFSVVSIYLCGKVDDCKFIWRKCLHFLLETLKRH